MLFQNFNQQSTEPKPSRSIAVTAGWCLFRPSSRPWLFAVTAIERWYNGFRPSWSICSTQSTGRLANLRIKTQPRYVVYGRRMVFAWIWGNRVYYWERGCATTRKHTTMNFCRYSPYSFQHCVGRPIVNAASSWSIIVHC